MKKTVALLLALCMIFVLCACGAEETAPAAEEASAETAESGYVMLDEAISTEQYGIAFKLGNDELRNAVLAGVYQLLADGTMKEIASKEEYALADMICMDEANAITFDMDSASAEMKARATLIVGFDAEYPPYGYRDDSGEYTGFDLEMAEKVCEIYGWELKKQPIDWDAKDMELNSGNIDCIWNGMTMTGRESEYTWSDAYIDNSIVVLTRSDTGIETLADLEGKAVVTQAGSSALAALTEGERADLAKTFGSLEESPDYNSAMLGLDSGLYDAVAIDIGVAMYYLNGGKAEAE